MIIILDFINYSYYYFVLYLWSKCQQTFVVYLHTWQKKNKQIMRLITNQGFTEINGNYRQAACEAGKTLLYLENVQQ